MNKATLKKKVIAVSTVCVIFFLLGILLYPRNSNQPEYIIDKQYEIRLSDVEKSRSSLPRTQQILSEKHNEGEPADNGTIIDLKAVFSEGLINTRTTLKYFKHMEHLFRKSTTLGEHFDKVKQYLFSHFPEDEAGILFDTYEKYLICEMDLLGEYRNFTGAGTPEEALDVLARIQDFRRARLGRELADKLFGADVKAKEYAFRRAAIVTDDLYGEEKENRIRELNEGMWGNEADDVEAHPNPYNRYQEKIKLYQKDLGEMASDAARQEKIRDFRKDFFEPETVEKLDAVDRQIAEEQQRENDYKEAENQILETAGLSDAEKEERIRQLQEQIFKDSAEEFRRRDTIQKDRESFIRQRRENSAPLIEQP